MKTRIAFPITLLCALSTACDSATAPRAANPLARTGFAASQSPQHLMATGTFAQSAVTSLNVRAAGKNTILEQTSEGTITGTISGDYEDDLKVVIHPNGKFTAHFTITCTCSVQGRQGVLELVASDTGELVSPTLATFAGRATIRSGTGELAGLAGVLDIAGTVDVPSGLATYGYSGTIHFRP